MFVLRATVPIPEIKRSGDALKQVLVQGVRHFFPGYFALVMATGIVSIAAQLMNLGLIAWLLFDFNLVAYPILWLVTFLRMAKFLPDLISDLRADESSPSFLTMVASAAVLGAQFLLIAASPGIAFAFLLVAALLWIGLMYIFLTAVTIRSPKPTLEKGINGGWLVVVVSSQSISVLATLMAPQLRLSTGALLSFGLAMFLLGVFLYLVIITLVFYRFAFFPLSPGEFRQSYWINMGATAISALAGSSLVLGASEWTFLVDVLPFLRGLALLLWVVSTWWIPLLLILEIWRYVDRRSPVRYDPRDWDIVFPLGMYAVSTFSLSLLNGLQFLSALPFPLFGVAFGMWIIVCAGMFYRMAKQILVPERA